MIPSSDCGEGRKSGKVLTEPVKAVPSSLELAERALAALLSLELAKDESLDFLDAIDGGRFGRGFSNGKAGIEELDVCWVVAEETLIEGTLVLGVLECGNDFVCCRGVSSPMAFAKKRCVCESSSKTVGQTDDI